MSEVPDRERYLRLMSDRLHDRFLERPAYLDLGFIRAEINKLDSLIDTRVANGEAWPKIASTLGAPVEYADAVFASRLLSPEASAHGQRRTSVLPTVLKVLFIVAPVNFIFAVGPLLIALLLLLSGWVLGLAVAALPVVAIFQLLREIGAPEHLFLVSIFAVGVMILLTMNLVSRLAIWMIWTWLSWNLAFLRGERGA